MILTRLSPLFQDSGSEDSGSDGEPEDRPAADRSPGTVPAPAGRRSRFDVGPPAAGTTTAEEPPPVLMTPEERQQFMVRWRGRGPDWCGWG